MVEKDTWQTPLRYATTVVSRGPAQATAFDADRQRSLELLPAMSTPPGMTAMFLDLQRYVVDVDLLDHSGRDRRHGLQVVPATGTEYRGDSQPNRR